MNETPKNEEYYDEIRKQKPASMTIVFIDVRSFKTRSKFKVPKATS